MSKGGEGGKERGGREAYFFLFLFLQRATGSRGGEGFGAKREIMIPHIFHIFSFFSFLFIFSFFYFYVFNKMCISS